VTSDLADLEVCLTCLSFRGTYQGRDHRCQCHRDASWRASEWEGYDIPELITLCKLCARDTMDSGTRWSWLVCETCRDVNRKIGTVTGGRRHGALPLGRHSLMNGVSLEVTDQNESHIRGFAKALSQLSHIWIGIFDWWFHRGALSGGRRPNRGRRRAPEPMARDLSQLNRTLGRRLQSVHRIRVPRGSGARGAQRGEANRCGVLTAPSLALGSER
jgi:hypothetical protein